MAQQIEIEYKTLLSLKDYQKIFTHYQLSEHPFAQQTNVYFDTPTKELQARRWGLRIRRYEDSGELTLKCPTTNKGLLEITDPLSLEVTTSLIEEQQILTTGEVAKQLQQAEIAIDALYPTAELTTKRYELVLPIGLLALDHSWYNRQEDYELELEVPEETQGEIDFFQLLAQLDIPYQAAENKIVRALKVK